MSNAERSWSPEGNASALGVASEVASCLELQDVVCADRHTLVLSGEIDIASVAALDVALIRICTQRAMSGDPKFVESQQLPDVPYARWAQMLGLNGIRTDDPSQLGELWEQALSADRLTVFEVLCDPEVPPLPPHITIEQARSLTKAIIHGDPSRRRIIAQSIRQKLPEIFSGG
jgi:hypothetical protein